MSGSLLLGIAAFGAGWMYITRDAKKAVQPDTAAASAVAAAAADAATVAAATPPGAAATIVAVDNESPAPHIGDSVAGVDGGQVMPVDPVIVEGHIVAGDSDKSTGGADPSVQRTAINREKPDETPPAIPGDALKAILGSKYGIEGIDGLTTKQISDAYRDSAAWSSEVF